MSWQACRRGSRPLLGLLLLGSSVTGDDSCINGVSGRSGSPQGAIACQYRAGECPVDPYDVGPYDTLRGIFRRMSWRKNTCHANLLHHPCPPYWQPGYGYHETQWRRGESGFDLYSCPPAEMPVIVEPMAPTPEEPIPSDLTPPGSTPAPRTIEPRTPYSPPAETPAIPKVSEPEAVPRLRAPDRTGAGLLAPPVRAQQTANQSTVQSPEATPAASVRARNEQTSQDRPAAGSVALKESGQTDEPTTTGPSTRPAATRPHPLLKQHLAAVAATTAPSAESTLPPALSVALTDDERPSQYRIHTARLESGRTTQTDDGERVEPRPAPAVDQSAIAAAPAIIQTPSPEVVESSGPVMPAEPPEVSPAEGVRPTQLPQRHQPVVDDHSSVERAVHATPSAVDARPETFALPTLIGALTDDEFVTPVIVQVSATTTSSSSVSEVTADHQSDDPQWTTVAELQPDGNEAATPLNVGSQPIVEAPHSIDPAPEAFLPPAVVDALTDDSFLPPLVVEAPAFESGPAASVQTEEPQWRGARVKEEQSGARTRSADRFEVSDSPEWHPVSNVAGPDGESRKRQPSKPSRPSGSTPVRWSTESESEWQSAGETAPPLKAKPQPPQGTLGKVGLDSAGKLPAEGVFQEKLTASRQFQPATGK